MKRKSGTKNADLCGQFFSLLVADGEPEELDLPQFIFDHDMVPLLLAVARNNDTFDPEIHLDLVPEEFREGGENAELSSLVELKQVLEACVAEYEFNPMPWMEQPKRRKTAKRKTTKKSTNGRKKKAAGAPKGTRAGSVTAQAVALLTDKKTAKVMLAKAGSIVKLAEVMAKKDVAISTLNLGLILRTKFKIKPREVIKKAREVE